MECNYSAPYAQLAVKFAEALVSGHFQSARACLTSSCAEANNEGQLKAQLEEMTAYAGTPATHVMLVTTMEQWPDQRPNDVGWAYVAIDGEGFSEAVTVIVENERQTPAIRYIEWGRP